MTSIDQNWIVEYKQCAGKDCPELGVHYLRIRFIKKCGWFCDSCRNTLLDDKLADEAVNCQDN